MPEPSLSCVQAEAFQKKGRQLRNKMWWQNCRMKLIVLGVVLLLGLVIFLLVCFTGVCVCVCVCVEPARRLPDPHLRPSWLPPAPHLAPACPPPGPCLPPTWPPTYLPHGPYLPPTPTD